jgi:hypothetical protein
MTRQRLDELIADVWKPGIRADCRRIQKWIDENSASWPAEIRSRAEGIRKSADRVLNMLAEGKPDALIATRHFDLWSFVRTINRELDKPDMETGRKVKLAARSGHETVHGTDTEKRAKWQAIANDLRAEVASGTKKTAAYAIVAEKHGVSAKTVQRVPGYLNKS